MPEPEVVPTRSAAGTSAGPLRQPPRMEDVAVVAGVSHRTVSRVLNDFPGIRPSTRVRVLAVIKELGYRRNTAARTLVTRRSGSIGVVTADMNHFGPASIMLGLESVSRAVEAVVIIVAHRAVLALAQSLHIGVPLVLVEYSRSVTPLTAGVDQIAGARLATNHLLDLGHRSVVHLPGPGDWLDGGPERRGGEWHWKSGARRSRPS